MSTFPRPAKTVCSMISVLTAPGHKEMDVIPYSARSAAMSEASLSQAALPVAYGMLNRYLMAPKQMVIVI
jgi:hypothetical protein